MNFPQFLNQLARGKCKGLCRASWLQVCCHRRAPRGRLPTDPSTVDLLGVLLGRPKGFDSRPAVENVCELLIRHEWCGVGAPGSGGGTRCATSLRAMEALVFCSNYTQCASGPWKHEANSFETGRLFFLLSFLKRNTNSVLKRG